MILCANSNASRNQTPVLIIRYYYSTSPQIQSKEMQVYPTGFVHFVIPDPRSGLGQALIRNLHFSFCSGLDSGSKAGMTARIKNEKTLLFVLDSRN